MQTAPRLALSRLRGMCPNTVAILVLGGLLLVSSGCAKARAETSPDGPPLLVPSPPPRVLAPVTEPEPVLAAAPEEPPAPPPPAPVRTPPRRPAAEARTEPATPTPPQTETAGETRELRATPTAAGAPTERGVRDLLARASRDLGRVSYARLSIDGKDQYDQSKRFSEQAEDALRVRNVVFAATLADKAASLAAELLTR